MDFQCSDYFASPSEHIIMTANESNEVLHNKKAKKVVRDIESPVITARRQQVFLHTESAPSSSSLSNIHLRHPRQGRPLRCCTATNLLYTAIFVLLFLWIILHHLLAETLMSSNDYIPLHSISSLRNNNITMGERRQHWQSMISWSDQMWQSIVIILAPASSSRNNYSSSQRMEEDYSFIFMLLLGLNVATMLPSFLKHISVSVIRKRNAGPIVTEEDTQAFLHNKLLRIYLPAYLLATSADWLQGPYKYALYSTYGYTKRDIAHLFVAGYGSG